MMTDSMEEFVRERFDLAYEKIGLELNELNSHSVKIPASYSDYFTKQFEFLKYMFELFSEIEETGIFDIEIDRLKKINDALYNDILPEHYTVSYCNPTYAVDKFGKGIGRILSAVSYELRSVIPFVMERQMERVVMRAELLLEIYCSVKDSFESEEVDEEQIRKNIRDIIYWYVSDYYEIESSYRVAEMVDPSLDFAADIIRKSDFSNPDYLYRYGEYISDTELRMAQFLADLPEEDINKIADTFSEGYRIGFEVTRKDLSKKTSVNIRYPLGFERVIKRSMDNFEKMGLKCVIYRAGSSFFRRQSVQKIGYFGANPNRQFDHDHSKDEALFLDGQLQTRKLECLKAAFEQYKELAYGHAGPAVMEVFGEEPFVPENNENAYKLSKEQQSLFVKGTSLTGALTNEYIKGEERSFTIMAFPVPAIGEQFEDIFKETLEINTLDYYLYRRLQQTIIDSLDKAEKVHIVGKDGNKTDIMISLIDIEDATKQTKFENCVADVNIPVGEVFTSPVLKGTTGVLHVSEVYLNDLKYVDLKIDVEDGFIKDYSLSNYDDEEKNKAYFSENVLFNHETLPMGEFAIGTNTRAYAMGKKFDIQGKLPILIAEKTGPHFAFGDTCYSHAEDVAVFNPDGKEIIARDNEVSIKRKEDFQAAYFNCHTDVTLPYNEIGLIEAIGKDGTREVIIENGRFALDGLEELNNYLTV